MADRRPLVTAGGDLRELVTPDALLLPGAPGADLHAATKAWVDDLTLDYDYGDWWSSSRRDRVTNSVAGTSNQGLMVCGRARRGFQANRARLYVSAAQTVTAAEISIYVGDSFASVARVAANTETSYWGSTGTKDRALDTTITVAQGQVVAAVVSTTATTPPSMGALNSSSSDLINSGSVVRNGSRATTVPGLFPTTLDLTDGAVFSRSNFVRWVALGFA